MTVEGEIFHRKINQNQSVAPSLHRKRPVKVAYLLAHPPQGLAERELAKELGMPLGKTSFCLQALIKVGLIKTKNFRNAGNKTAYLYKLPPSGIEEKARVTSAFLQRKLAEYESIQQEIAELQADMVGCEAVEKGERPIFYELKKCKGLLTMPIVPLKR